MARGPLGDNKKEMYPAKPDTPAGAKLKRPTWPQKVMTKNFFFFWNLDFFSTLKKKNFKCQKSALAGVGSKKFFHRHS